MRYSNHQHHTYMKCPNRAIFVENLKKKQFWTLIDSTFQHKMLFNLRILSDTKHDYLRRCIIRSGGCQPSWRKGSPPPEWTGDRRTFNGKPYWPKNTKCSGVCRKPAWIRIHHDGIDVSTDTGLLNFKKISSGVKYRLFNVAVQGLLLRAKYDKIV